MKNFILLIVALIGYFPGVRAQSSGTAAEYQKELVEFALNPYGYHKYFFDFPVSRFSSVVSQQFEIEEITDISVILKRDQYFTLAGFSLAPGYIDKFSYWLFAYSINTDRHSKSDVVKLAGLLTEALTDYGLQETEAKNGAYATFVFNGYEISIKTNIRADNNQGWLYIRWEKIPDEPQ